MAGCLFGFIGRGVCVSMGERALVLLAPRTILYTIQNVFDRTSTGMALLARHTYLMERISGETVPSGCFAASVGLRRMERKRELVTSCK